MSETSYKSAGVDLKAAEQATRSISVLAKKTFTPGVIRDVGLFGGFFQPDFTNYNEPILVASVDGVGTKLKIAFQMGIHQTVGEDLVNHCVNDIMTGGAVPLFFLDYIATSKLEPMVVQQIVEGLVRGCEQAQCALIGGETAELPGFYQPGEYDIAGTILGIVEKDKIIDGRQVAPGDILIGVPSTGLHTNGYSLARMVLFERQSYKIDQKFDELGVTLGEALLAVHRSYQPMILALKDEPYLKAMSHITGGGIVGNTQRVIPKGLSLRIYWENWEIPPLFKLIQKAGQISDDEMRQVFNMGIGFIFIVSRDQAEKAVLELNEFEEFVFIVGEVFE